MPEPTLDQASDRRRVAKAYEDEQVTYARHAMAMSYVVTVVHFLSSGNPRIDVLDSRSGKDELACIGKEFECEGEEVKLRLIVTEDLPRATYDLLEHTLGLDPRLLDDHRSHGHGPGFVGQADLGIDKAPLSSASITIPFDLQIGSESFPSHGNESHNEPVETEIRSILNSHQLINYLRYDWQSLSVGSPLPALFFTTYRRLSVQRVPGLVPTVAVLLYPPLWDLKSFQGSKYKFHVPADLQYPGISRGNSIAIAQYLEGMNASGVSDSGCAFRTQKLLNHILDSIGSEDDVQQNLTPCISTWLMTNAYAAFEASAESSIRSCHDIKTHINDPQTRYIDNQRLCERLRQITEIKLHLMDKATVDLGISLTNQSIQHAFGAGRVPRMDYALQQWQRSRQSLQWVLDDVGHLLRSNESDLQIDLMNTQIKESRKAMQQAEVVKRLTALAFVFIPISTVCSAFGMNIEQFSHDLPSVWVFVSVALVVAIFTVICSLESFGNVFWALLSLLDSGDAIWREWWQNIYDTACIEQASFGLGVASIGANLAGVKPWKEPARKKPMRLKALGRVPIQVVALIALLPFRLLSTISHGFRRFEERGKAFKGDKPS